MDMQTPDHKPHPARPGVSALFFGRLIKTLAAMPAGMADDEIECQENLAIVQELLEAFDPQDAAAAQLAALAIAASQAALDDFARAARRGVTDETATRLRTNAFAGCRTYASVLHSLRKPAPELEAAPEPAAEDVPPPPDAAADELGEFQPRDRFGQPIPTHRTDLMTRAQVLAVLAYPRNPELEAAATAEEDAMIAEQAAKGRGSG